MEEKSIAFEMLQERNHLVKILLRSIVAMFIAFAITVAAVVGTFIWYLNQYDFSSTTTTETTEVEANTDDGGDASAIVNGNGEVIVDGESEGESN